MGRKHVRFLHYIKIDVIFNLPYQPRRLTVEFRNNCQKTTVHFFFDTPCIICTLVDFLVGMVTVLFSHLVYVYCGLYRCTMWAHIHTINVQVKCQIPVLCELSRDAVRAVGIYADGYSWILRAVDLLLSCKKL